MKTGKEKFFAWHMHSDNAPSHFKSGKTMHYFSKLRDRLTSWANGFVVGAGLAAGSPLSFRVFWEFGAPGHGKGVWDGIGAWLKRSVREDITDHRPGMKTILLEKGTILSAEDVAGHLKLRFDTEAFVQSHQGKTINQVVVLYTPTKDIIRPKPDHEYDKMPGMKKTFLFMGVREGVVLQRKFACWCRSCMHASAPGEGTMDSNYCCTECESESLAWEETSIGRSDAAGIANGRVRTRNKARELRDQLKQHFARSNQAIWIAVQNRGEQDPDQYWIGRALRIVEEYTTGGYVEGVDRRERYDVGDLEIAVEWFERPISGGDERRTFKLWTADEEAANAGPAAGHVYTFNSTELRAIGDNIEMTWLPPVGGVPLNIVRRGEPRAAAGTARQNWQGALPGMVRQVQEQRADPPEQLWEILAGSERLILDWCCR